MRSYMYILRCNDGSYYTGSTKDLDLRLAQHHAGEGSKYTRKKRPVKLVYYELYDRIDEAFNREKQIQGWSRKKKEALIHAKRKTLPELARSRNGPSTSSGTDNDIKFKPFDRLRDQ
jgi:putative endonuclease